MQLNSELYRKALNAQTGSLFRLYLMKKQIRPLIGAVSAYEDRTRHAHFGQAGRGWLVMACA